MKSKISFFNKTIFLKNVTLYWPIWVVYTIFLVMAMPFSLWLSAHDRYDITPLTDERMIQEIYYVIRPPYYIFVIAIAAVIIGMALFNYLYKSQSANMIHALPVDRTELFGTNVISGLAFLIVPQIFTFVVTVLICLAEGITRVEYLGMWLIFAIVTAFIAFSFVTVCAFFTGQLVAMPIYVIVINFLAYAVSGLVSIVVTWFGYGVTENGLMSSDILLWFSPLANYMSKIDVSYVYDTSSDIVGIHMSGSLCMLVYFVVAIALYALAYFVYRIRKIEHAGDLITVGILKPIFRWGVGTLCGFYVTLFFTAIFGEIGYNFSYVRFGFGLLFFGALFYFIADMFVRKTFHVFKKQNWKGCGQFCIVLIATFVGMAVYANIEEKYVPNEKDISYVTVNMGYYSEYRDEDIDKIVDVHKMIIDNVEYYEELDKNGIRPNNVQVEWINISYYMKNGKYINRNYRVPYEGDGKEIIDTIRELETEPENFLRNLLGHNYESMGDFTYGYLDIMILRNKHDQLGYDKMDYESVELTATQGQRLYQATIADGLAGRLNKYNAYYSVDYEEDMVKTQTHSIHMEFRLKDSNARGADPYYSSYRHINVQFGPDCENIIQAIVDLGIGGIDSPEDIYWEKW